MTAIMVVIAMREHADLRSDHVDGQEPESEDRAANP